VPDKHYKHATNMWWWFWAPILVAVGFLLFAGCSGVADATNYPANLRVTTIEGHKYVTQYKGGIVHAASCTAEHGG
jgi:hypothetical protein